MPRTSARPSPNMARCKCSTPKASRWKPKPQRELRAGSSFESKIQPKPGLIRAFLFAEKINIATMGSSGSTVASKNVYAKGENMEGDVPTIGRDELKEKIERKDNFVLVETLAPGYYNDAHLPGAINLPPEDRKS